VELGNTPVGATEMIQFVSSQDSEQELHFPIMLKVMTGSETNEYHLRKLAEWTKKWEQQHNRQLVCGVKRNVYRNGKLFLEEPSDKDKEWVLFRLSHSNTWPKMHENKIGDWKHWK
jgi:hypothetical protein